MITNMKFQWFTSTNSVEKSKSRLQALNLSKKGKILFVSAILISVLILLFELAVINMTSLALPSKIVETSEKVRAIFSAEWSRPASYIDWG